MRCAIATLAMCLLAAPLFAGPPSLSRGAPAQSLEELRVDIAWYGAACVLGASEMDTMDGPISTASLAEETGVPLAQIEAWAQTRQAENAIAVDVLLRGGEPLQDPPEPFLTILRQRQSDCQDVIRARRVLESALERGTLPDVSATTPRALRTEWDPLPFDFDRHYRLTQVLRGIDTALAAGDYAGDLEALLQAVSGIETLSLGDVEAVASYYSIFPDADSYSLLAVDLLLPDPDAAVDLTAPEIADVLGRIEADAQGPFARYYLSLLIANPEQMPEGFVMVWMDEDGNATRVDPNAPVIERPCERVHGTAALACEMP